MSKSAALSPKLFISWQEVLPPESKHNFRGGGPIRYGLVVDVETTGLNPRQDEIVELAAVPFAYDAANDGLVRLPGEYSGLRDPGTRIPTSAVAIHGITESMVRGLTLDSDKFLTLVGQSEFLVAHNAPFDYGFVTRLFPTTTKRPWLCSVRQIDWTRHGYSSRSLDALLAANGIARSVAHRAREDCDALLKLLACRNSESQSYCGELLRHLSAR